MDGTPGTPAHLLETSEPRGCTPRTPGTPQDGTGRRQYTMRSPLFGLCSLIPQDAGTAPAGHTIGYVELEGAPGKLVIAVHDRGWKGRSLRPLSAPVARWYKVEKADGTPLF